MLGDADKISPETAASTLYIDVQRKRYLFLLAAFDFVDPEMSIRHTFSGIEISDRELKTPPVSANLVTLI